MALDTALYKLNKNAFRIVSDVGQELVAMALDAIDSNGSPKQPRLENKLIEVGSLWEQVMGFLIFSTDGTQIIGITGESVQVINQLLTCLHTTSGIQNFSQFPTPFTPISSDSCCLTYEVGSPGSILVSNGTTYVPISPTAAGQVPVFDGIQTVWSNVVGNGIPAGGLNGQFLRKYSNNSFEANWQSFTMSMVTDVTSSAAELNILDGVNTGAIGPNQINTLIGINTALTIQQQLDAKSSAGLPQGQFFVGNASGIATPVLPTGDVTFNDTGVFAYTVGSIVDQDVNTTAAIGRNKLASGTSWRIIINNGSGVMSDAPIITPNRALVSDGNGIPIASGTTAEKINFISTLSSNAQDQFDGKLSVVLTPPVDGDIIVYDGTNWVNFAIGAAGTVLTSDGTTAMWSSSAGNGIPAGGLTHDILRKASNTSYDAEWHTLVLADITDVSATAAEVNVLSGVNPLLTVTEINYLYGVTNPIQTQITAKLDRSLAYNAIFVGDAGNIPTQLGPGTEGYILKIVSGAPVWAAASPPGDVSGVAPSTDNAVVRWNGIAGNSIQNSAVIIDDSDNITGVASLTGGQIDILNQAALRLHETGSTNYVGIRAAGTMSADYTITLPAAAPAANTFLNYNGSAYVWATAANAFTSLTDVPASYTGSAGKGVRVNAGETGLEFFTISGSGTVTSVLGTPNRISVSGTATINPTLDIDVAYVGQSSITTLGTVGSGTWNATNISLAKGGTGASLTDPNADRILFWDDSANAVTWLTAGSGLSITGTTISSTGSYDNEMAQDAIGSILTNTTTIGFTYDDVTPTITANVNDNSISNLKLRQSVGLSVIGNATNAIGNVADIIGTNGQVLRVSGSALGFGNIVSSALSLTNSPRILGKTTVGAGPAEEIQVDNGLTLASGFLKLGGALTGNTALNGGGFSLTGSGYINYQFSAATNVSISAAGGGTGGSLNMDNAANHLLYLGQAAGVVFNIGSDATGDIYYRNGSGKYSRLAMPAHPGKRLLAATTGLPVWSNLIVESTIASTVLLDDTYNGKMLVLNNVTSTIITIPTGLEQGYEFVAYRASGAGPVTFTGAVGVSLQGPGATILYDETFASLVGLGGDVFAIAGAIAASGLGSVTSVAMADLAGIWTVTGTGSVATPITTTGTLTVSLATQTANYAFFGPATGSASVPTFRAMVIADLPNDVWIDDGGTTFLVDVSHNKKNIRLTSGTGCVVTIPAGLPVGFSALFYRASGAGTISFINGVGLAIESVSTTIDNQKTGMALTIRATNIAALFGGGSGGGGGAVAFTDLTDVPSTYVGQAAKVVRVNALETGLEFYTLPGSSTYKEVPSGAINGVNVTYTLSISPTAGSENVYLNGILQESGAGNDYTISGSTITFLTAPETNDKIIVTYGTGGSGIPLTDGNKTDITLTSSASVYTINNDVVTFAKMQNISTNVILGRVSGGTGDIEQLTGLQANTILPSFTYTLKGLVPAPTGSGSVRFLREDQTWQIPAGGGGGITNSAANNEIPKSDGLNIGPSGVYSSTLGNVTLGDTTVSGTLRTIQAIGSGSSYGQLKFQNNTDGTGTRSFQFASEGNASYYYVSLQAVHSVQADVPFFIQPKGSGEFQAVTDTVYFGSGVKAQFNLSNNTSSFTLATANNSSSAALIQAPDGVSAYTHGVPVTIKAGSAYTATGNGNGGSLTIKSGAKRSAGSGTDGIITLDALSQYVVSKGSYTRISNNSNSREIVLNTTAGDNRIDSAGASLQIYTDTASINLQAITDITLKHGAGYSVSVQNTTDAREIELDAYNGTINFIPVAGGQSGNISVGTSPAATAGNNLNLVAGAGGSGNTNGGDLTLAPGIKSGTGLDGDVVIGEQSGTGQSFINMFRPIRYGTAESSGSGTIDYSQTGISITRSVFVHDTSAGSINYVLPFISVAIDGTTGLRFTFVRKAGTNTFTVSGASGETINGSANYVIPTTQYSYVTVQAGATGWYIIEKG